MGMASSFALICLALNDLSTCSYEGSPDLPDSMRNNAEMKKVR